MNPTSVCVHWNVCNGTVQCAWHTYAVLIHIIMYCTLEAPYIVQKVFVVEMLQLFTAAYVVMQ